MIPYMGLSPVEAGLSDFYHDEHDGVFWFLSGDKALAERWKQEQLPLFPTSAPSTTQITSEQEQRRSKKQKLDVDDPDTFDYIVCGGGAAGCAVAARLAESKQITVLLLEAGVDNKGLEDVDMVFGAMNVIGTDKDWNIQTTANKGLQDRKVFASRGRLMGGSTSCNGTICVRGVRKDFDDWNLPGWSGDEMFEYMTRAETFDIGDSKPSIDTQGQDHGHSGPIMTNAHELAPISQRVMDSFQCKGLAFDSDMFSTGRKAVGCGNAPRTVFCGRRSTAADYIHEYRASHPDHAPRKLTVKTEALVDRVLFEEASGHATGPRATGVQTASSTGKIAKRYYARKEVIVSGGAYCSPAILMRSGIGAQAELDKHAIRCRVDLPGVGQNLLDHPIVWSHYEVDAPARTTIDEHIYKPDNFLAALGQWKDSGSGPLSSFPFGSFAYARLDAALADAPLWRDAERVSGRDPMGLDPVSQPSIEYLNSECFFAPGADPGDLPTATGKQAFGMAALLMSPRSRGCVRLAGSDPTANPVVEHNYLADPLDALVLAEACRFANEIVVNGCGTRGIVKGSWPARDAHHTYKSREQWADYVRSNATTCYHPAGTCRMGRPDDPMAVLDSELRVRGVRGLRVVDASAMPTLNSGHPQMPIYGMAERAAELIKAAR